MFLFVKQHFFQVTLIIILFIMLAYVSNITAIPESVFLFQNEKWNVKTMAGVKVTEIEDNKTVQTSVGVAPQGDFQRETQQKNYEVSLAGIHLKTVTTNIIQNRRVVPLGELVGLKLYTQGVLVVGLNEIEGEDKKIYKPYEEAGIEQGDSILQVNNETVESTAELIACVSKSHGKKVNITYLKKGKEKSGTMTPVKTSNNTYKLGLWVRDASAGVGTLSFYDTETKSVVSLGHGIQDVDTGEMVDISSGEFVTSTIVNIKKGEKETPGRIEGSIENGKNIGNIEGNTKFGVYGHIQRNKNIQINEQKAIELAGRNDIKEGEASIICTLADGKKEEYKVKIQKIFKNNNEDNKSMIIKVTDPILLEKTGGIIQGMSGSPIIQNGKLVGALTHVLVSDPTTGYGVFADLMLSNMS